MHDELVYPTVEAEPDPRDIGDFEEWWEHYSDAMNQIKRIIAVGVARNYMTEPDYDAVDTPSLPRKFVRAEGPGELWVRRQIRLEQEASKILRAHLETEFAALRQEASERMKKERAFRRKPGPKHADRQFITLHVKRKSDD